MSTPKQVVEELLSRLPDDCSLEDIQYHLYVIVKVRNGLKRAENEGTFSQEDVEMRQEYDLRALRVRKVGSGRILLGKPRNLDPTRLIKTAYPGYYQSRLWKLTLARGRGRASVGVI